jgi:hypothetical protein
MLSNHPPPTGSRAAPAARAGSMNLPVSQSDGISRIGLVRDVIGSIVWQVRGPRWGWGLAGSSGGAAAGRARALAVHTARSRGYRGARPDGESRGAWLLCAALVGRPACVRCGAGFGGSRAHTTHRAGAFIRLQVRLITFNGIEGGADRGFMHPANLDREWASVQCLGGPRQSPPTGSASNRSHACSRAAGGTHIMDGWRAVIRACVAVARARHASERRLTTCVRACRTRAVAPCAVCVCARFRVVACVQLRGPVC